MQDGGLEEHREHQQSDQHQDQVVELESKFRSKLQGGVEMQGQDRV